MNDEELKAYLDNKLYSRQAYNEMYPKASSLNVFSVSTLAYSVDELVDKKLGRAKPFEYTFPILVGLRVGEGLQIAAEDDGWIAEQEIELSFPFKWSTPKLDGFVLLGHADLFHPTSKVLIENKTSIKDNNIHNYMTRQASVYAVALGCQLRTYVYKINHETNLYHIPSIDVEVLYKDMIDRAYKAANLIDAEIKNGSVKV